MFLLATTKMLEINYVYVNQDVQLFGDEYILTHTHCMKNVQYQNYISIILQPVWQTCDLILYNDHLNHTLTLPQW